MRREWAVGLVVLGCGGRQTLEPVQGNLESDSGTGGAAGSSSGGSGGATGGTGGGSGGSTTGCSLAVTASGKLPAPITADAQLDGIAVVATDVGFVIAYRDRDPSTGSTAAQVTYLSDTGGIGAPANFDLTGCLPAPPEDGVGATYRDGHGLVVMSLQYCDSNKGAGAVFLPFDSIGTVSPAVGPQNPSFTDLGFGRVSGVAPSAASNEFEVVYHVAANGQSTVERLVLQGSEFKSGVPILHPFGDGPVPWGLIATSSGIRAMMAPDATQTQTEIQISGPTGDSVDPKGSLYLPHSPNWGALTAWNNRVAAIVSTPTGIGFAAGALESGAVVQLEAGLIGNSWAYNAAITTLREHLFIAMAGEPSNMEIATLNGINGNIDATSEVITQLPIPTVGEFDPSQFSIAAARNRVALVWSRSEQLTGSQSAGGWALLECAE